MTDPKLTDERGRLLALHRYGVLDSLREPNFESITSIVRELIDVPICAVSLVDQDRQWFKSMQGLGIEETPRSMAFCDHTIRTRQPMIVNDALADSRFAENPLVIKEPFIRAYAGAPLTSPDGYNLGSLCVIDRRTRDFNAGDIALLERFAKVVIDQMELRTLAHRDFLTGALTRRAFTDAATSSLEHGKGSSMVAVLDVDHFKRINDTFGHPAGDEVLRRIAATIRDRLRAADLFGRLGGEEFGLLFHNLAAEQSLDCAERLREAIAELSDPDLPSVTVSIGLAEMDGSKDLEFAIAKADAALYAAKRDGRNRCVLVGNEREQLAA